MMDASLPAFVWMLVHRTIRVWMSLPWNVWLDQADKLTKILALVGAAVFAYLKFFKDRVYHTRLEPAVTAKIFERCGNDYLLVTSSVKNFGISIVEIIQRGTAVQVFGFPVASTGSISPGKVELMRIATISVFENHRRVVGSETIEETSLLALPPNQIATEAKLRIVTPFRPWSSKNTQWHANAIIDIPEHKRENLVAYRSE